MAYHKHTKRFAAFFRNLNPSPTYEAQASSQYGTIKGLLESASGPARTLGIRCFLQGSYQRETAIYSINDIDIVALCTALRYPPAQTLAGISSSLPLWSRDSIFASVAGPLLADWRYKQKVVYGPTSMCIKVQLGIKVEILPAAFFNDTVDPTLEPFCIWRPESQRWDLAYARYHQERLSAKNAVTNGNFIPAIKVFKHIRSLARLKDVASFHIESFLYALPDDWFAGAPADYIAGLITKIGNTSALSWYTSGYNTPCGEHALFSAEECSWASWDALHTAVVGRVPVAALAASETDETRSAIYWQAVLDARYFPMTPA